MLDPGQDLRALRARTLLRDPPPPIAGPMGPIVDLGAASLICLSSNNYLGIADHPALADTVRAAVDRYGVGAGASRLITGTQEPHVLAEQNLARFVSAEAALLFSSGYAANVGTLSALATDEDVVFSDALNHASLIDGCRLARASVHVYRHCDPDHLEALLRAHRPRARRALIVTDALFSMDGDRAPLPALSELARTHDAALYVDEAHSLGVLGPGGRGACAESAVIPDLLVGTLGKAFGVSGAFVAADRDTIHLLLNRARSFVFSTAPPAALAAAATTALELVAAADTRRDHLRRHARRLRTTLLSQGYRVPNGDTPIVPLLLGDPSRALDLDRALRARGVLALAIRPPTVPEGASRLRLTPIATHTDEHLDHTLSAFHSLAPTYT